jgi:hypothetical protein
MSSFDFEEAGHKLLKIDIQPGQVRDRLPGSQPAARAACRHTQRLPTPHPERHACGTSAWRWAGAGLRRHM